MPARTLLLKKILRNATLIYTHDEQDWLTLSKDVLALSKDELNLITQLLEEAS